ncbi:MAG TPA: ankyrin repeat domain-containing protein, partial [Pirellulales bacterium]
LHLAAEEGQAEVVKELLAHGAKIDAENKTGLTPLHLAAQKGRQEIVQILLEHQKKPAAVTVDLIGVVHIGEKEYYQQLNEIFKEYDAVLYELVAPPNTRVPKDAREKTPGSVVGMAQSGMKDVLKLDFQLHYIDYHVDNLVHADMSPEQFEKKMSERGESFLQMMLAAMGQGIAKQTKPGGNNDLNMFMAMFSSDRATALKRAMAEQFEDLDSQMEMFGGKDGSTIITERNKVCLEVLAKEIAAGKKKVAIFYGAGHMPDMANRLLSDFGLHRTGERWLVAWDMREGEGKGTREPVGEGAKDGKK